MKRKPKTCFSISMVAKKREVGHGHPGRSKGDVTTHFATI